jgi:hypothetical protein
LSCALPFFTGSALAGGLLVAPLPVVLLPSPFETALDWDFFSTAVFLLEDVAFGFVFF